MMKPTTASEGPATSDQRPATTNNGVCRAFFRFTLALLLVVSLSSLVSYPAFAGQTVVARETDRYFYKDGKALHYEGQFEYTYFLDLDKDTLTRTRVFDFRNNKITPDETVYHIEKQLLSHPSNADRYILVPVVRAIGQTNADSIEILSIENKFVNIAASSANEFMISRAKRLK